MCSFIFLLIFHRILYGRLQLTKENLSSAVFTNLAGCSTDELESLLSLIVEFFFSALGLAKSDYQQLTSRKRNISEEDDASRFLDVLETVSQGNNKANWSRLQAYVVLYQSLT